MWTVLAGAALASPTPTAPLFDAVTGPHAAQVLQYGTVAARTEPPRRAALPPVTPGPDLTVYGYLAWWNDDLNDVPWDDISHIAIFDAYANSDGSLSSTSPWDQADEAVAMAAPYGVKVHLCVTNFSPSELSTLLSSSTARGALIDELAAWQASTGADGINVDFEGLPLDVRDEMVTFVRDLEARVGEVVLAVPPVDWAGSWDYSELTQNADVFIMGYGYHWGGSAYAGPSDPLESGAGTVWDGVNSYSLSRTVDDVLADGADPARVILGLPLYGMRWPTSGTGVPAPTIGGGSSVIFTSAWALEAVHGRSYEPDSKSTYLNDGGDQVWYGDVDTVRDRILYVRDDTSIAGFGFWALHYDGDDATMWDMIRTETAPVGGTTTTPGTPTDPTTPGTTGTDPTTPEVPTSPDWIADAGLPFLAYVGDIVVLSAEGSLVPDGQTPQYRWVQVHGPAVALVDADTVNPSFVIERTGNLVFEVQVGDGVDAWSAPASSHVVVIDPDLANRHDPPGCGCATTAPSGVAGALLLTGLAGWRRRRHG